MKRPLQQDGFNLRKPVEEKPLDGEPGSSQTAHSLGIVMGMRKGWDVGPKLASGSQRIEQEGQLILI